MIQFTIPGKPQGKGRPKFARMGNFVRAYTPEQTASYEALVQHYALQAGAKPDTRPAEVVIYMFMPIPKTGTKKTLWLMKEKLLKPVGKPDVDNVTKIVQDALNGVAWLDDAQVYNLRVEKEYDLNPRVEVHIDYYDPVVIGQDRILSLDEYYDQHKNPQAIDKAS